MAFCSFASLFGGACGPSPENPNVIHFVDSKNSRDRDVTEHTLNFVTLRRMLQASIAKENFY